MDRGTDAEPLPQQRDAATTAPLQTPLVALPPGWSLGRLVGVAGVHVGQSMPQMTELVFGPLYKSES